jgi:hypothetical protein
MIGFAVPSFFVSFAWNDTVYFLSALLTGLYVAARLQMERNVGGQPDGNALVGSLNQSVGWRVRRSAQHAYQMAQIRDKPNQVPS